MRPGRFYKVNDVMLAEAMRQLLPLAEQAARDIGEKWAVWAVIRAHTALDMWSRQERGRLAKLDGKIPPAPRGFLKCVDNPDHPDPGQSVPPECLRPKRTKRSKPVPKHSGVELPPSDDEDFPF